MKGENSIKLYRQRSEVADRHRRTRSSRCSRPCRASPTLRCSLRSASRPSRSTSTGRAPHATVLRPATSTPPSASRSAAISRAISTSPAATGISRSSFASRRNIGKSAEAIQNLRIGVAGAERHRHADSAQRSRLHQSGVGRGLYLSRAAGALPADQVLGARARPRQRHPGGAGQGRDASGAAAGIAGRLGRRVRQSAGRHQAALDRGADQPGADRGAALVQFRFGGRHAARHERDPDGDLRRRRRPSHHGHAVQRLGCDRLHRVCSASP